MLNVCMPLHTVAKGVSDSWLGGAACVSAEFFAMPMSTDIVFGPEFAEGFGLCLQRSLSAGAL